MVIYLFQNIHFIVSTASIHASAWYLDEMTLNTLERRYSNDKESD